MFRVGTEKANFPHPGYARIYEKAVTQVTQLLLLIDPSKGKVKNFICAMPKRNKHIRMETD